jgi:hypothetical protein
MIVERIPLNRELFLAMLEQLGNEVMIPTSTIGVVEINLN